MQLSPETRSILRQYKTLINERRRESGLGPVTTAKVLDEICESATRQCAVYLCGHFILQGGQGDGQWGICAACSRTKTQSSLRADVAARPAPAALPPPALM